MSDWIKHNGGPQPVADDVWVEVQYPHDDEVGRARARFWACHCRYRILNQHLIDAARLEGIRLGLEAAAKEVDRLSDVYPAGSFQMAAYDYASDRLTNFLNPDTIAKEADND